MERGGRLHRYRKHAKQPVASSGKISTDGFVFLGLFFKFSSHFFIFIKAHFLLFRLYDLKEFFFLLFSLMNLSKISGDRPHACLDFSP